MPPPYEEKGGNIFPSPQFYGFISHGLSLPFPEADEYKKRCELRNTPQRAFAQHWIPRLFLVQKETEKASGRKLAVFRQGGNITRARDRIDID